MRRAIIIDTTILCVYLEIPGMKTCGKAPNVWDCALVNMQLDIDEEEDAVFVLPLATIVETGNHIAQIKTKPRKPYAEKFADLIRASVNETKPWAAFSDQVDLWSSEHLLKLADEFPILADQKIGVGDATIKNVADAYLETRLFKVEIFTGDGGLEAYQHTPKDFYTPRRRK